MVVNQVTDALPHDTQHNKNSEGLFIIFPAIEPLSVDHLDKAWKLEDKSRCPLSVEAEIEEESCLSPSGKPQKKRFIWGHRP